MAISNSEYWAGSNGQSRYKTDNYRNSFADWFMGLLGDRGDAGVGQRQKQIDAMNKWNNGEGWVSKRGHDKDNYTYDDYLDYKMFTDALNGRMAKSGYNVEDENDNLTHIGDFFDFTDNVTSDIALGEGKDALRAADAFDVDTMVFDENGNLDLNKLDDIMATIGDRKFNDFGTQSWENLSDEDLAQIKENTFDDNGALINAVQGNRSAKDSDVLNSFFGGMGKGYDVLNADYDAADRAFLVKNALEFLPLGVFGGVTKGARGLQGLKNLKGMRNLERANALDDKAARLTESVGDPLAKTMRGEDFTRAEQRALERAAKYGEKAGKLRGRGTSQAVSAENKAKADQMFNELVKNGKKDEYGWGNVDRNAALRTMQGYERYVSPEERAYAEILEEALANGRTTGRALSNAAKRRGLRGFVDDAAQPAAANAAGNTAQTAAAQANRFAGRNLDDLFEGAGKDIKFKDKALWKTLTKEEQKAFTDARNKAAANSQKFDPVKWIKENLDDFKTAGSATPATEAAAAAEAATAAEAAAPAAEAAAEATKGGPLRWLAKHPKLLVGAGAVGVGWPVVGGYLSGKEENANAIAGDGSGKTSISDLKAQAGEDGYVDPDSSGRIWFITASGRRAPLIDPYGNPITTDNFDEYFTD